MFKKLIKNSGIKAFCLVAATVLWIYVSAGQNTIGKFPGNIRIKTMNIPSGFEAIYDIKSANIKIMAEPSVWNKLSADSFSAYVDLSSRAEGVYELPVVVTSSVPGVSIVGIDPDRIMVRLEPIISKEVDIRAKIEGAAGEGLIAGTITLDPAKTTIQGAKSVINGISEAIAVVRLDGEKDNFERTIILSAYDEDSVAIENIQFSPPEVKASIPIVKASNNKTVGIKVQITGSPKAGYYLSEISTNPNTIDIVGQPNVLSDINFIETSPLDIGGTDSVFEKDANLILKSGVSLQSGTSNKVKVKLTISKIEVSKEIEATIAPINLVTNYQISSINPSSVKVVCYGSADTINNLKSNDVVLSLDFSNRRFTENPTTVNFEIASANFKVPAGVTVGSFTPSFVSATLEKN